MVKPQDMPQADVLTGGFPCQDFSSSGPKVGLAGKRGRLYEVLVDYMRTHRPKVVVGENVPHLARLAKGQMLETILDDLEAEGYNFQVWELYGPDYGLPQSRRRLILMGVRNDLPGFPQLPRPTHATKPITVDLALADLEEVADESIPNQSQYFIASRATAGGGQGDHSNVRGKVAYCIRANARGRIQFHYELDRRLTVRECARLQSFPDEFVFPFSTQRNLTLIGNAVPPILGHAVAKSVAEYLASLSSVQTVERPTPRRRPRAVQEALAL
jgi:DNA (cytosine-5)-methyltransferase 1